MTEAASAPARTQRSTGLRAGCTLSNSAITRAWNCSAGGAGWAAKASDMAAAAAFNIPGIWFDRNKDSLIAVVRERIAALAGTAR